MRSNALPSSMDHSVADAFRRALPGDRTLRAEVEHARFNASVAKHGGRIVKAAGDVVLRNRGSRSIRRVHFESGLTIAGCQTRT